MTTNPYESPETTGHTPAPKVGELKFRLVELLVIIGVIGVLIVLLLPARRHAGGAARRTMCQNNLKQIAYALQNYEGKYGCLPPAYTVDEEDRPLHSWRTLILPFVEQNSLYEKIDLSKPWDDPVNRAVFETRIQTYQCRSLALPDNQTNYLAVVASGSRFQPATGRKLGEFTDQPSTTLMVIEVPADQAVPWMSPQDADEELILNLGKASRPPHPGGLQAAFVDGTVLFLRNDLKPEVWRALISVAGDDDKMAQTAR